jgi:hypothetical protein
MATDIDFIRYVCEQVSEAGTIEFKKMFGDYMVYCDGKPALLVCDNAVFVKCLDEVKSLLDRNGCDAGTGLPYKGAKPHYMLDIDNRELAVKAAMLLAKILPFPKPKKKRPA